MLILIPGCRANLCWSDRRPEADDHH